VPDSGGLPLRAMVMVLLFLAVVFLLLGLRAVFSGGDSAGGQSNVAATSTAAAEPGATATSAAAGPKSPVFVYNVSSVVGLAGTAAQQLKEAGWNAEAKQEDLEPHPDVTGTTVYFTDAAGEKSSAEEVAKILKASAPVERAPELKELQPGVIVLVTG
jgi:hypothetical protein